MGMGMQVEELLNLLETIKMIQIKLCDKGID